MSATLKIPVRNRLTPRLRKSTTAPSKRTRSIRLLTPPAKHRRICFVLGMETNCLLCLGRRRDYTRVGGGECRPSTCAESRQERTEQSVSSPDRSQYKETGRTTMKKETSICGFHRNFQTNFSIHCGLEKTQVVLVAGSIDILVDACSHRIVTTASAATGRCRCDSAKVARSSTFRFMTATWSAVHTQGSLTS